MSQISSQQAQNASKGVEWLARMGYSAKGLVYVVVGGLATMAALGGGGGQTTGTKGAVAKIGSEPFGQVLLVIMAIGLAGYVAWQLVQAIKDPEHMGHGGGALIKRGAFLISAVIYATLAVYAVSLLVGSGGGGSSKDSMTAKLMSHPGGVWAVAAIGIIIIGVGISQFMRAYKKKFQKAWSTSHMRPFELTWATRIARFGLGARGVVFLITGGFLVIAAWQTNPNKATGLDGALDTLARQSYGQWLLGVMALGLICYGLFCFINAVYRQIDP
ncbi:MAG: DUF1206 domain-containing protein [Salinisphaera sp.]|jgi:hypothetical protein|nr:DUF1206 domain-containing protein [Salinisphaera sp.]